MELERGGTSSCTRLVLGGVVLEIEKGADPVGLAQLALTIARDRKTRVQSIHDFAEIYLHWETVDGWSASGAACC